MAQYSIWYAVPYMLLLAAFYFLAYQEQRSIAAKRNRQTLHIWCGVLFLFFFGLRGFVGWDWHSYYPLFESIPSLFHLSSSEFDTSELIEPGYIIYVAFVKLFTDNYHVFIFISVLIDFLLLHKIFKRYHGNQSVEKHQSDPDLSIGTALHSGTQNPPLHGVDSIGEHVSYQRGNLYPPILFPTQKNAPQHIASAHILRDHSVRPPDSLCNPILADRRFLLRG